MNPTFQPAIEAGLLSIDTIVVPVNSLHHGEAQGAKIIKGAFDAMAKPIGQLTDTYYAALITDRHLRYIVMDADGPTNAEYLRGLLMSFGLAYSEVKTPVKQGSHFYLTPSGTYNRESVDGYGYKLDLRMPNGNGNLRLFVPGSVVRSSFGKPDGVYEIVAQAEGYATDQKQLSAIIKQYKTDVLPPMQASADEPDQVFVSRNTNLPPVNHAAKTGGHTHLLKVTQQVAKYIVENDGFTRPDDEYYRAIPKAIADAIHEQELEENGRLSIENILDSTQFEIAQHLKYHHIDSAGPPPVNLVPRDGLIRDIVQYILDNSVFPQPVLAVAAATTLVSVLAGRKYKTQTGLRTNIYLIGLARSGSGKDAARKVLKNILSRADCMAYLGGDRIASGAGLISAIEEYPAKLFLLDEFGLMLQSMTGKNSGSYQQEIVTNLTTFYSDAGSIFAGTEYADKRARARKEIHDPCVCLYATSTHQTFYDALSSREAASGTVARFLIVDAGRQRPKRQRFDHNNNNIPEDLIMQIQSLCSYVPKDAGNLSQYSFLDASRPDTVMMTGDVYESWDRLDDELSAKMTDDISDSIYARVAENAAKLSMVYAIAKDHTNPVIDMEAFSWGRDFALWSANLIMEQLNRHLSDNEHERTHKMLERAIQDGKAEGKTKAELSRELQKIRPADQDRYLESLIATGTVVLCKKRSQDRGRPRIFLVHGSYFDAEIHEIISK